MEQNYSSSIIRKLRDKIPNFRQKSSVVWKVTFVILFSVVTFIFSSDPCVHKHPRHPLDFPVYTSQNMGFTTRKFYKTLKDFNTKKNQSMRQWKIYIINWQARGRVQIQGSNKLGGCHQYQGATPTTLQFLSGGEKMSGFVFHPRSRLL